MQHADRAHVGRDPDGLGEGRPVEHARRAPEAREPAAARGQHHVLHRARDRGVVLLGLVEIVAALHADDDRGRRTAQLGVARGLDEPFQCLAADHPESPRLGLVVVRGQHGQVQQLAHDVLPDRLGRECLERAPAADRLVYIHSVELPLTVESGCGPPRYLGVRLLYTSRGSCYFHASRGGSCAADRTSPRSPEGALTRAHATSSNSSCPPGAAGRSPAGRSRVSAVLGSRVSRGRARLRATRSRRSCRGCVAGSDRRAAARGASPAASPTRTRSASA